MAIAAEVLLPLLILLQVSSTCSRADNPVTFPLPSNCLTSCGNITFQYPFGVGGGCFRPGFDLVCNTADTTPPKLFLANNTIEVIHQITIQYNFVYISALVAVMGIQENYTYASSTSLVNSPYRFSPFNNNFWVIGCSAVASLVDLTNNNTIVTCVTTCPNGGFELGYDVNQTYCKGVGCCYFQLGNSLISYSIRISRTNQAPGVNASSVKAFIGNDLGPTFFSNKTIPLAVLSWNIKLREDQTSCKDAKKEQKSYACLSQNSDCDDESFDYTNISAFRYTGYYCKCLAYQGNPYIPDGCHDPSSTTLPSSDCATTCGNISIPFPFGLKKGCYKDTSFSLLCNQTLNPPVLLFNLSYSFSGKVTNIMLDEGQIEVSSVDNSNFMSSSSKPFAFFQERAVFKWVIEYETCEVAMQNLSNFACRSLHSTCLNTNLTTGFSKRTRTGYICKCLDGFQGNPYLPGGCQDINECQSPEKYTCYGDCVNLVGNYTCNCPPRMDGDPTKEPCISHKKLGLVTGVIIGVCVGFGILLVIITSIFAIGKWKKIHQKRIRMRHFHQNHGLLLQQLIASNDVVAEKTKIFSLEELEKATNNFDTSRILGHGGHGTVYKGILSDQRVVAIKRSKITIKAEIDEFINEVTILSQINHRNVVKLFGCCLETEVPLLVYEFISSGTLFHHLHDQECKSTLSWRDRLRIGAEAAGALAYLHSSASISIFHRDMKSSNILLDEYYTVKVSDFGASRFIPLNQTHVFTAIQGTFGYLDPEYYQTCQLTEKSDVYSFGVILLELLTGEKPIYSTQNGEERHLVMQFLHALKENHQFELFEARVVEEGMIEELDEVANLAEMCLKLKGSERPTMKEVEVKLQFLLKTESQRRAKEIPPSESEMEPLLSHNSNSFSSLPISTVRSTSNNTRNYSLERELVASLGHPR